MKAKITKPLCVLSDANVIIDAHQLGIWNQLVAQCQMFTTKYIQKNEARYFATRYGRETISLREEIKKGHVTILTASHEDMQPLYRTFESWFLNSLDAGEREALALILAEKAHKASFCTTDRLAIQALAMLGKSNQGISFERLLERTGFRGLKRKLRYRHKQSFFKACLKEGLQNFVTGMGLIKPPQ